MLQKPGAGGASLVKGRFRGAITAREIPSDFPFAMRASLALDIGRGLIVKTQMGVSRKKPPNRSSDVFQGSPLSVAPNSAVLRMSVAISHCAEPPRRLHFRFWPIAALPRMTAFGALLPKKVQKTRY